RVCLPWCRASRARAGSFLSRAFARRRARRGGKARLGKAQSRAMNSATSHDKATRAAVFRAGVRLLDRSRPRTATPPFPAPRQPEFLTCLFVFLLWAQLWTSKRSGNRGKAISYVAHLFSRST
ncbi:unnamed protein product, partial [Amoebophrya sp. A120]